MNKPLFSACLVIFGAAFGAFWLIIFDDGFNVTIYKNNMFGYKKVYGKLWR